MAALTLLEVQAIQLKINPLRSKRVRILQGLKLLLNTITKDRGYTHTVEEAGFDVKTWRDKTAEQTPVIYIVDDTAQLIKHAGCIREYTWTIRLFGVLKGKDLIDFEEFIADVEECIYDNNTLFGQVNKMECNQVTTDNQLFSELNDSGAHLYEIELGVEYTRNARSSR